MARRNPVHEFDYAWIALGVLVASGILTAGIFRWLLDEAPIIAAFILLALFAVAWFGGSREGNALRREAAKMRSQAQTDTAAARELHQAAERMARESHETAQALIRQRQAIMAMSQAAEAKNRGDDLRFIDDAHALPLEKRIEVSLRVGAYSNMSRDDYLCRRQELHARRVQEWRAAQRFGQPLLPLVEAQHGLCGDPSKDRSRKGCRAYLYNFPVTAVHIDHIIPRSKGGSNDPDNLQALCSYCNTSAGNRTGDS